MSNLTWMYKSTVWLKARASHLRRFPLCEACKRAGRITPATVVHHKTPHGGDWNAFLNQDTFESLCAPCHDGAAQRSDACGYDVSVGVDGWPKDATHPTVKTRSMSHPEWFKAVRVPMTIVCGAPASGKSTYVQKHINHVTDTLIDLDIIARKAFSKPPIDLDKNELFDCLRIRNDWLMSRHNARHLWFIVAEPEAHKRQWWQDKLRPERIVVIETPLEVCLARAAADETKHRPEEIIRKWWKLYKPRKDDVIVSE